MSEKIKSSEDEYQRRIRLCAAAILGAAKDAGLGGYVTGEYQGCEIPIRTEFPVDAKVVVIMETGYRPRWPKYVTLTVHGYVWYSINKNLNISGGGICSSAKQFLPDSISHAWLKNAIKNTAETIRNICTVENMNKLCREARIKRRQAFKEPGNRERFGSTYMDIGG